MADPVGFDPTTTCFLLFSLFFFYLGGRCAVQTALRILQQKENFTLKISFCQLLKTKKFIQLDSVSANLMDKSFARLAYH